MDSSMTRNIPVVSNFLDHSNEPACSISYPIDEDVRQSFIAHPPLRPGDCEVSLDFPCIQVYIASSRPLLNDKTHRVRVRDLILQMVLELERMKFFDAFHGVRFEVYNGRREFGQYFKSGRVNRACIKAISDHAIREREARHARSCFQGVIDRHLAKNTAAQDPGDEAQEAVSKTLSTLLAKEKTLVDQICATGECLSPEIASFNRWREKSKAHIRRPCPPRRKSASELDLVQDLPSFDIHRPHRSAPLPVPEYKPDLVPVHHARQRSYSTSEMQRFSTSKYRENKHTKRSNSNPHELEEKLPLQDYMFERLAASIQAQSIKFRASITPASFYDPPRCHWHNLVIIVTSQHLHQTPLHILRFGRELSLSDVFRNDFSTPDRLDCTVQQVSMGPNRSEGVKHRNLAVVLGRHLFSLGLAKPEFLAKHDHLALDAVHCNWFTTDETHQRRTSPRQNETVEEELARMGYELGSKSDEDEDVDMIAQEVTTTDSSPSLAEDDAEMSLEGAGFDDSAKMNSTYCLPDEIQGETAVELVVQA